MVDQGFVVHRPKMFDGKERLTKAELHHRKARFEELGYPCVLDLDFKPEIENTFQRITRNRVNSHHRGC
jgi:hypothetical protein